MLVFGSLYIKDVGVSNIFGETDFTREFEDEDGRYRHYFEMLNGDERAAYIQVLNEIDGHPKRISVPLINAKQMDKVFDALLYDNPGLLCIESGGGSLRTSGSRCWFEPSYGESPEACRERGKKLSDAASGILAGMDPSWDDYEKEKYIHDTIVLGCRYHSGAYPHSAYGAIVEGEATCAGYAKSAQLLLSLSGVKCCLMLGTAQAAGEERLNHAWNIVWIGEKPYHLDLTWDDPVNENAAENYLRYVYFNITDDEISQTHDDFAFEPGCIYTEANYYRREGLFFSSYDGSAKDTICGNLLKTVREARYQAEFRFAGGELLNTAVNKLIEGGEVYDILRYVGENVSEPLNTREIKYIIKDDYNILCLIPAFEPN